MPIPFNADAEQAILGAILDDPHSILYILDLKPAHFYGKEPACVYDAMVFLAENHKPIDLVSLSTELAHREQLDKIGGKDYIGQLHSNGENIRHYADLVKEAWVRRNLASSASEIMGFAYDTTVETPVALTKARESLLKVSPTQTTNCETVAEIGARSILRIQERFEHPDSVWGLKTGLKALDNALGGLEKKDNIIIAGRPGSGKSSLADTIAVNVARQGKRVVLFTMEMSREMRLNRMVCIYGGYDFTEVRRGKKKTLGGYRNWTDEEQIQYYQTQFDLERLPILINDQAGITTTEMEFSLSELALVGPVDLVIVDYNALMGDSHGSKRYEQMGFISRGLKRIAMALEVPLLNLTQLNRECETRADKKPELADLRDTGELEQDADIVILIWRAAMYWKTSEEWRKVFSKDPYPGESVAELNIAKFRNGNTGYVKLAFDAPRMRFMDLEGA